MEYMHKQGVIHRDIKSGNLFLTGNGNINIGDFGLATVRDSTNEPDYSVVGTPHYMSPELLSRKTYDFTTDIWYDCGLPSSKHELYQADALPHSLFAKNLGTV